MAEFRDVLTVRVWGSVSTAVSDAVRQSNWLGRCPNLLRKVANRDLGDFHSVDVPDPCGPNQHAAVGSSINGFVLFRHWNVRDDASPRKSIWRRCNCLIISIVEPSQHLLLAGGRCFLPRFNRPVFRVQFVLAIFLN